MGFEEMDGLTGLYGILYIWSIGSPQTCPPWDPFQIRAVQMSLDLPGFYQEFDLPWSDPLPVNLDSTAGNCKRLSWHKCCSRGPADNKTLAADYTPPGTARVLHVRLTLMNFNDYGSLDGLATVLSRAPFFLVLYSYHSRVLIYRVLALMNLNNFPELSQ